MAGPSAAEILAVGMTVPVGLRAPAAAAAVRAGITRLQESYFIGRGGEQLVMGLVKDEALPPLTRLLERAVAPETRQRRMLRLAGGALREALGDQPLPAPVPLLLALPESWPGLPAPVGEDFLGQLLMQADTKAVDPSRSRTYAQGRAGGLLALHDAQRLLTEGRMPFVVVGGVDTYLDLPLLTWLDAEERLPTLPNPDSFIPGEGAAFLLLGAPGTSRRAKRAPVAHLLGVGTGVERGHRYSQEVYRGEGLAEAFQALFTAVPEDTPQTRCVYAGLNGESFWAKEWGVAWLRNSRRFAESCRVEHPVENFGDPGAALGAILLGLAAIGLQRGYRQGPCLVWCSSDREERGAAMIHSV